jgi:tRNA-Thr(GGU) m(6)t(6)A37 methyltransferase TsaA
LDAVTYTPIGNVRSPFAEIAGMPLQAVSALDVEARIEIHPEYAAGLRDLDGFSHLHVLWHLHRASSGELELIPFLDVEVRGVFATRAPGRPNRIGLSVARLVGIEGATLHVSRIDLLDGTPVLDLKPYVPEFDAVQAERIGWFEGKAAHVHSVRADGRFEQPSR